MADLLLILSLLAMIATIWIWPHSYLFPRAFIYRIHAEGRPLQVRTFLLGSDDGRLQIAFGEYRFYMSSGVTGPQAAKELRHELGIPPQRAATHLGWRRELIGFGLINDWEAPPSTVGHATMIQLISGGHIPGNFGVIESFKGVWVPYWAIIMAAAAFPARRLYLWAKKRRRRELGRCIACGYDLRGSNEKCPECGALIVVA